MSKNKFYSIFLLLFLLVGFSLPALASQDNEPDQYVHVNILADNKNIQGGETIRLGIEQNIYPKWHSYWLNPGDSGLAFDITWDLPEGFSVSDLEWPTPQKIYVGELTNYGYEGQVTLLQNLTVPETISDEPLTLTGTVNLLVCHDICIPETHNVSITFNDNSPHHAEKIAMAEKQKPTLLSYEASFYEDEGNLIIDIKEGETVLPLENIYTAPEEWGLVQNSADTKIEKTSNGYRVTQKRGERDLSEAKNLPFIIAHQDSGKAYRLVATPSQPQMANQGEDLSATSHASDNEKQEISFLQAVIFAMLGGLVLNLMPCVFPVLSIKALSLVNLGGKEEKKAKLYGLSYTAGILISFSIIAGILIALKAAGAEIGWGFQLQNPIVISLLAYLIFIIGLNLAGVFEFSNKFGNVGQNLTQQSGNKGAFFTGVLATLVATPCTAPFMGVAMGYALTQGAVISMIIFLMLGFGLALPYLALCFIPALRTKLPRPGAWMERFKELLSFPMFLTAAFLVWVLAQQVGTLSILIILSSIVAISFLIWLWKHMPKGGLLKILSILIIISLALFVVTAPFKLQKNETVSSVTTENTQVFSNDTLSELLEGDDAIFTNMTADWCITCKVNERVALKTTTIENLFKEKNIQYLKGDWTNHNTEITQYLNKFNRQGVPLYVYYAPRDPNTGKRPEAVILPQVLTTTIIQKTIQ